jgi:hypothetical protein
MRMLHWFFVYISFGLFILCSMRGDYAIALLNLVALVLNKLAIERMDNAQ